MCKFYANVTDDLIQNLPFNVNLIRHTPSKRTNVKSSNVISNLALTVGKSLECVLSNVSSLEPHGKVEDLCDKVKAQWKLYQCELVENVTVDEVLPENPESVKETSKVSYQENTFKDFVLNVPTKLPKHEHIDIYWGKIGSIKDGSGHLKYLQLFALVKCVISISRSNSIPERCFSINKYLLDIHGNSTQNDTIVALRMVKDHIKEL